jgi:hypothetical protein
MSKSLKLFLAVSVLLSIALGAILLRKESKPTWDGTALLARAEASLEGLPTKEAGEIRALLISTGPGRYDDRASAWFKTSPKEDLKPVVDYAIASLRAMAEGGDPEAMYFLYFLLTQRIATGDEGFQWLEKAAKRGYPHAVFDVTKQQLKGQPEKLRAAMVIFSTQENDAGFQALHWFAYGYEKGKDGLPQDATKAAEFRARAKVLLDKLNQQRQGQK